MPILKVTKYSMKKPICKFLVSISLFLFFSITVTAQSFTHQDTLRGSITSERVWWDVQQYTLDVAVDIPKQSISGSNIITYKVLNADNSMQIDLQDPMQIDEIVQNGKRLTFTSDGNAHFIALKEKQIAGKIYKLTIFFSGKPVVAKRPPWDGGFTWSKDSNGKDFVATSNQGIGASIWWPLKDHPSDEPDKGVIISITTPKDLMDVSNGRLISEKDNTDSKTWTWQVINPINTYGVNINIGDYIHLKDSYKGENGILDMDYYVLRENEAKAKEQFKQAPMMMEAFENWFGPYPFYEDGYKLVQAPYLGMEHQSSVTYGNKFENGYLGRDLSGTGWGLKFDFIIIHESGHEWFANNITDKDVADMWIHEGFTAYSENLYLDYFFGKEASAEYVIGTRKNIQNDRPIIGSYNVDNEGSSDMYYKGANMLHTLRQLFNDDDKWRQALRGLNKTFYHQIVTTKQIEDFLSEKSELDLKPFFDQYLRTVMIPLFEYKIQDSVLKYRYGNVVDGFNIPVIALINGQEQWLYPTTLWQTKAFAEKISAVDVKKDFYVDNQRIKE